MKPHQQTLKKLHTWRFSQTQMKTSNTLLPQCVSVLIRGFWLGPGDFSNHLRGGGEEEERVGQHVKDRPPISWSHPRRLLLLFPKFLQLGSADVGSPTPPPSSHHFLCREEAERTEGEDQHNSSKILKPGRSEDVSELSYWLKKCCGDLSPVFMLNHCCLFF